MNQTEIIINKISQDKISFDDGLDWFDNLDLIQQKEVIRLLVYFIRQAHPDKDSINLGLETAPIRLTMTPVVLLKTQENYKVALDKIIALPDAEINKSFVTLMSVFKAADKKRREISCKNGCTHAWHHLNANSITLKKPTKYARIILAATILTPELLLIQTDKFPLISLIVFLIFIYAACVFYYWLKPKIPIKNDIIKSILLGIATWFIFTFFAFLISALIQGLYIRNIAYNEYNDLNNIKQMSATGTADTQAKTALGKFFTNNSLKTKQLADDFQAKLNEVINAGSSDLPELKDYKNTGKIEAIRANMTKMRNLYDEYYTQSIKLKQEYIDSVNALVTTNNTALLSAETVDKLVAAYPEMENKLQQIRKTYTDFYDAEIAFMNFLISRNDYFTVSGKEILFNTDEDLAIYNTLIDYIAKKGDEYNKLPSTQQEDYQNQQNSQEEGYN
jgi:hypothetical protein